MTGWRQGQLPRREQQRDLIIAGLHPLSLVGPQLRLHPDAPADRLDPDATGSRCGSCRFRVRLKLTGKQTYPKCTYPARTDPDAGPAADVRAWWPACVDYQQRPARRIDPGGVGGDGG